MKMNFIKKLTVSVALIFQPVWATASAEELIATCKMIPHLTHESDSFDTNRINVNVQVFSDLKDGTNGKIKVNSTVSTNYYRGKLSLVNDKYLYFKSVGSNAFGFSGVELAINPSDALDAFYKQFYEEEMPDGASETIYFLQDCEFVPSFGEQVDSLPIHTLSEKAIKEVGVCWKPDIYGGCKSPSQKVLDFVKMLHT